MIARNPIGKLSRACSTSITMNFKYFFFFCSYFLVFSNFNLQPWLHFVILIYSTYLYQYGYALSIWISMNLFPKKQIRLSPLFLSLNLYFDLSVSIYIYIPLFLITFMSIFLSIVDVQQPIISLFMYVFFCKISQTYLLSFSADIH